jgi:putative nucleotidyltransferase with HDIG domain
MNSATMTNKTIGRYLPIYLDSLRPDTVPEFDLYLDQSGAMVLYRSSRTPFTEEHRQTLIENNISRLYVSASDHQTYRKYLEHNLRAIVLDSRVKESVRAGIVYESAKGLIEELFARPTMGENIRRSQELVESTVGFVLTGQAAFANLLQVMSFDNSTYTHSVNVCGLTLALAQFTGIRDPKDLKILGTGALLHDIGKTRIDDSILCKTDPLTDSEKIMIRKHPQWGCDILEDTNLIDRESYYPILEHHERDNCSGYPNGSGSREIHLYGKITAIADVFDAMTSERAYRPALDAYPVLKTMFDDEGAFDRRLLEQFTQLLGPTHE